MYMHCRIVNAEFKNIMKSSRSRVHSLRKMMKTTSAKQFALWTISYVLPIHFKSCYKTLTQLGLYVWCIDEISLH